MQCPREIIDSYGEQWGYQQAPFFGKTTDVDHLDTMTEDITVAAEWILREDFDIHLGKKAGLLIGAEGKHLKELQNKINEEKGENAVMAIWAKRIPDGRMAFTAYGKSDDGVLNALKEISDRSIEILQNYGWTVYPTPVNIVFKRSVLNRNASAIVMPGDPKYLSAPSVVQLFAVPTSDGATVWSARQPISQNSNGEIGVWDMWVTKEAEA